MIISRLNGGLGNQMFQYAIGKALAIKNKSILKLDISFFQEVVVDTPRNYELHKLNILEEFATKAEVNAIKEARNNQSLLLKLLGTGKHYAIEKDFSYEPKILNLKGDIFLEGYFQSYKYFQDIRSILIKEFEVKSTPNLESSKILENISNSNSVSLHVRRGDYISNAGANKVHGGVCDLEYYTQAIEYINQRVENPSYFIFSDDPDWASKNINTFGKTSLVSYNPIDKNDIDLRLMYSCKHNIIANSSFSWWGAWLNKNPDKIVISPKRWFSDVTLEKQAIDIIPDSWVRI